MLFPSDKYLNSSSNGFERAANSIFKDSSERFTVKSRIDYQKQFAHIYSKRLTEMRPLLAEKVYEKWGKYPELYSTWILAYYFENVWFSYIP